MNLEQIVINLTKYKTEIIKKLSVNHWRPYFLIKGNFLKNVLDDEFRRCFCGFYIMNGPMGLNDVQKNEFFRLLSAKENDLEKILRTLYAIPSYGQSHKLFLSFGTKLLHTLNNDLPIYDRNIAYVIELPSQTYPALFEERIKNRIDIYKTLKEKFDILLADIGIKDFINGARQELQNKASLNKFFWQNKNISDTKLLDSLLWALYSNLQ